MRIVLQGSLTPKQLGAAVKEILENTMIKAEAESQKYAIHNPVIEMNLNIKGEEQPMLLVDSEKNSMLTIHTGIKNGELVEYVEVDREELIAKFNEMVDAATGEPVEATKDVE